MARRTDLLAEITTTLDAVGDYTGDWLDSSGVTNVRILYSQVGTRLRVQESTDQVFLMGDNELPIGYGEAPITARYFRVLVMGGTANATLRVAVRAVN